jgi:rhamnose transport system ATP-binding protein
MTPFAEPAQPAAAVLVQCEDIWKDFAGVDVLKGAGIELRAGEVHGIVGENGAGKSTLAKLIGGVHTPRRGTIRVRGAVTSVPNPRGAIAQGIALIHQEPMTFPDLTVAENIFIGRQPRGRLGTVDWRGMTRQSRELLGRLGVTIDPAARMRGLSVADQQMVEMAVALSQDARVFLMDETTASLTPTEVADLFRVMRQLRDGGAALAFIGHRMEEIFEVCDRLTVLRDGDVVASGVPTRQTTVGEVLRLMVGRPIEAMFARTVEHAVGPALLEVRDLSRAGEFDGINFDVRAGEIVALAGLVGAGRTEVARAVFGVTRPARGEVRVGGRAVRVRTPRDAMRHGLALVPEDRQHHGLLMPASVWRNATLAASTSGALSRLGGAWTRDGAARQLAADAAGHLRVKCRGLRQPVRELSGGNQQKVVLGKWLMTGPRVIIFDEPTRGIDVGAKAEVHRLISELAAAGKAVLMISSELPEVLAMSDRVLVMREGRITAEFHKGDATADRVIAAATGQAPAPAAGAAAAAASSPGTPGEG